MTIEPVLSWQLLFRDARRPLLSMFDVAEPRDDDFSDIRCPRCGWRPSASNRWSCYWDGQGPEPFFQGCGTSWNTFSTRGCCPGCDHQWLWTVCLGCAEWSLHEDWYEERQER